MNKRSILKTYRLIVYTNGDTELIPDQLTPATIDSQPTHSSKCSQRILQICSVLKEVLSLYSSCLATNTPVSLITFNSIVTNAINNVSKLNDVAVPTVMDKCTRQLQISKQQFVEMIYEFLSTQHSYKDTTLYGVLADHCLNPQDAILLEETFLLLNDFVTKKNVMGI